MSVTYDRKGLIARLSTVHIVPLTPMTPTGSIDYKQFAEHLEWLYKCGLRSFMIAAGTSQHWTLDETEKLALVQEARRVLPTDALVFAPISPPLHTAVRLANEFCEVEGDGIMFMPPSHNYQSDDGQEEFYETVIDQSKMPALIYKNGDYPSDDLLTKLSSRPYVLGTKYAVDGLNQVRIAAARIAPNMAFICGNAERYAADYMFHGACGYTSGAGNLVPRLTLKLHSLLTAGDYTAARRIAQLIWPIEDWRARHKGANNICVLHAGMELLGKSFGKVRSPLRNLSADEPAQIAAMLEPILREEQALA